MALTPQQTDELTELSNMAMSRAAKRLSILLNDEILLKVPKLEVLNPAEMAQLIQSQAEEDAVCVYQDISRDLDGRLALLLPSQDSQELVHALIGQGPEAEQFDLRALQHEAMTEIGNIILSSCVELLTELLNMVIDIRIPKYLQQDDIDQLVDAESYPHVIVFHTHLEAVKRKIAGIIILTLSMSSVHKLLESLDQLLRPNEQ